MFEQCVSNEAMPIVRGGSARCGWTAAPVAAPGVTSVAGPPQRVNGAIFFALLASL